MVVPHAFNPSIQDAEASLIYRVSSRTARATQRIPVSKNKTNKQKNSTKQKLYICSPGTHDPYDSV